MQANKEHLSAYFRPLPPSLALKQDGQAAWALVSSNQIMIHQCHKYAPCSFHASSQSKDSNVIDIALFFQALGMQESEYQMAKQGKVLGQIYSTTEQ